MSRRLLPGVAGLVLAALLVGCGQQPPAEAVPSLVEHVAAVDQAVVARDDSAAREALAALVADTERAVADGDLAQAEADDVIASAEALLARLGGDEAPQEEPEPEPEPEKSEQEPEPEPEPEEPDDSDDDEDENDD